MTEQGKGGVDSKISEIRHLIGNLASSQYENGQSGGKQTEHSCEVRTKLEATIIAALSAAQGECEALKAEVEETRQAAYRIQDEYNKAQAPLQLNHAAEVFIDRFVNDPPENYWSHNIVRDGEQFEIVVQRRNGLTPAQKNEKAEQRIAELERELAELRPLDEMCRPFYDNLAGEEGCSPYVEWVGKHLNFAHYVIAGTIGIDAGHGIREDKWLNWATEIGRTYYDKKATEATHD
jgi:hypothetical protein